VAERAPEGAVVGLYHAHGSEAPTGGYARWFLANGRMLALPAFHNRDAAMDFRLWSDPYDDEDLVKGPLGLLQPGGEAKVVIPDVLFVPGVGFTQRGERLGQGGGHYDRWLGANPDVPAYGLAWDCQIVERLPTEPHDISLRGVITPTRFIEGSH